MPTIDLQPEARDIIVEQGQTVEINFSVERNNLPWDITGYTPRAQVRRSWADAQVLINCTLANGKVQIPNPINGLIKLVLAPSDTSSILPRKTEVETIDCVYDLELETPGGTVYKVTKGSFTINREVTR